ncbi:hypothetical protein EHI8A_009340 [Entamoeba histolytica HM-1:IMSS-B]|uniref:Uncharacterized protein n=5 Tax=Entamoeba histolytica TaxID=5759 RepID=B1N2P2_ENTH1|nr:hypothetical protein EHI_183040 [Entamoeba histolytica HM-1:IMSS]EMD43866.1 Hypothetical protein EHI5A_025140 [Entamoeba histolytica KU27]EMH76751.1 hypothetical protein EHI8A_009340 [Entamoeba histolytica HM-1:IMSS-B]EMS10951.1 hypothetical protein KM1_016440 [Entamoeba histolytica HM-3:IMSS]GAT92566.1 hypothetical protein CL6EHI_183040 [Entamoeba histolytica]EDS89766.1 hypothetical protein EHI_183040 [Entamoeba histolytica HM-1:IMSS]|eukprot:XP_001913459.1 hypothetical protein EHI_183040 [Entamoeba histolytica HM-1:IMSS]
MGITSTQTQLAINKLKQINQSQKEFLEISSQVIEQIEESISEMVQSYEEKLKFLEHENKEIKQQLDDERNNNKKLLESQSFSLEKNSQENDTSKQEINNQNVEIIESEKKDCTIPVVVEKKQKQNKKKVKPQPRRQTKIKIMTTNEKAKRERAKMKMSSDSQKQIHKVVPIKQEIKNDVEIIPTTEFKELIPSNDIDIDKEIPAIVNVLKPSSEKLSIMDSMNNLKLMISQMKLEMKDEFEEGSNDDDFDSFE